MSKETVSLEGNPGEPSLKSCTWCGREIRPSRLGRPKKFCRKSCKQRAYESRKWKIGKVWDHLQDSYSDCYICGLDLDWNEPQTLCLDHVIATVHGGRTNVENLRPVHLVCNAKKGARLFSPVLDPQFRKEDIPLRKDDGG